MAQGGQRKCLCCKDFFFPNPRSALRQRYCAAVACRHASKAASQAAWLAKPGNVDYFKGSVHVQRARAWRAANPGRASKAPRPAPALQDPLTAQVADFIEQTADRAGAIEIPAQAALQDSLQPSMALLTGLIAHLFELTLQDDLDSTTRRLVQRGQELIARGDRDGGAGHEDPQACVAARTAATSATAVQLG
jgi:hypothetical protein